MSIPRADGPWPVQRTWPQQQPPAPPKGVAMLRRAAAAAVIAAMLSFCALPAEAATSKPLHLSSYTVSIGAPNATVSVCDYNRIDCGYVQVQAQFSGLDGRARPATQYGPPNGNLTGTVRVTRTYGCQKENGTRLRSYDRTVMEDTYLNTRRSTGFRVPLEGNTLSVSTYAFLLDAQPGNCPSGAQAMIYEIKASGVKLELLSLWEAIPSAHYSAPGTTLWRGAVPTPTTGLGAGVLGSEQ